MTSAAKTVLPSPPEHRPKWIPALAFAGAALLTAGLFVAIPLTQLLDPVEKPELLVRPVTIIPPPPKAPPPPPPKETPQSRTRVQNPEIAPEPIEVKIQQLDVSLSPGLGASLIIGAQTPRFEAEIDVVADIKKIFTFADLPDAPRLLNRPSFQYPRILSRRGVDQGKVVVDIEIQADGSARLLKVVSSTHSELEATAAEIVRSARFTRPVIDGEAVSVQGRWPITIKKPN